MHVGTARDDSLHEVAPGAPDVQDASALRCPALDESREVLENRSARFAKVLVVLVRERKMLPHRVRVDVYVRPYQPAARTVQQVNQIAVVDVLSHDAVRLLNTQGRRALRLADGMLEWRLDQLPVEAGAA